MTWKCAWKELPHKDGMYLCHIDEHYGIFTFREGRFLPNSWGDYTGSSFESGYIGCEHDILHWMELPKFRELDQSDLIEIKQLDKKREKLERAKYREEKKAQKVRGY